MSLFRKLGREVEEFKTKAERAVENHGADECGACGADLEDEHDRCPECGAAIGDGDEKSWDE